MWILELDLIPYENDPIAPTTLQVLNYVFHLHCTRLAMSGSPGVCSDELAMLA